MDMEGRDPEKRKSLLNSIQSFSKANLKQSESVNVVRYHYQAEGQAMTWGAGLFGQLGTGINENRNEPTSIRGADLVDVRQVSCGGYFTICLTGGKMVTKTEEGNQAFVDTRNAFAWGLNNEGQLGLGDTQNRNIPEEVEALRALKIHSVACGGSHAIAQNESGELYAWGSNRDGQLGLGHTNSVTVPTLVSGLAGIRIRQIACGDNHSLAVTDKGAVYVWGSNFKGQLGIGKNNHGETLPAKLKNFSGISQVVAGAVHSGFLTRTGQVYTCGEAANGRLGHGDKTSLFEPKLVKKLAKRNIRRLSFGGMISTALNGDGELYTWGYGASGGLGQDDDRDYMLPKKIMKLKPYGVKSVACGLSHVLVVTGDSRVMVWGQNTAGQLGFGHLKNIHGPSEVLRLKGQTIRQVSAGYEHSCVLGPGLQKIRMRLSVHQEMDSGVLIGNFRIPTEDDMVRDAERAERGRSVSKRSGGSRGSSRSTSRSVSRDSRSKPVRSSLFYRGGNLMRMESSGRLIDLGENNYFAVTEDAEQKPQERKSVANDTPDEQVKEHANPLLERMSISDDTK